MLGVIYYQKGDPSSAIPYVERALKGNKSFEAFHNTLGARCSSLCMSYIPFLTSVFLSLCLSVPLSSPSHSGEGAQDTFPSLCLCISHVPPYRAAAPCFAISSLLTYSSTSTPSWCSTSPPPFLPHHISSLSPLHIFPSLHSLL